MVYCNIQFVEIISQKWLELFWWDQVILATYCVANNDQNEIQTYQNWSKSNSAFVWLCVRRAFDKQIIKVHRITINTRHRYKTLTTWLSRHLATSSVPLHWAAKYIVSFGLCVRSQLVSFIVKVVVVGCTCCAIS